MLLEKVLASLHICTIFLASTLFVHCVDPWETSDKEPCKVTSSM